MTEEPEFLTLDDVLELHSDQIQRYGGDDGIREGICSRWRPLTLFTWRRVRPFSTGNKRTGLAAAYVFLDLNGHRLVERADRLYQAMIAIGTRQLDKRGLAQVFRDCAEPTDENG